MKKSSILARLACAAGLLAMTTTTQAQEERVLWYSIGDGLATANATTLQNSITNALDFAVANEFNAISILTRYRANAFYIPNRTTSTFANPEPRARADQFDELQFVIDGARARGLRVYAAWSAFLVTDGSNTYPGFLDPNWRMYIYESATAAGTYNPDVLRPMVASDPSASGLWVDPGIPAVRDYTIEVLLDLVENYDIDGVVLDRIRYPGDAFTRNQRTYGYTPDALAAYVAAGKLPNTTPAPNSTAFIQARRDAVTTFLADAAAAVHQVKPWVAVGGTPVIFGTSTFDTYSLVYQNIPDWSSGANPNHVSGLGVLDFVMPQYYRNTGTTNVQAMNAQRPDVNNMVHLPLFQTFLETGDTPESVATSICETRNQSKDMGWGIFSYNTLLSKIGDINAQTTTCGTNIITGSPAAANIGFPDKVGWDSTPPGAMGPVLAAAGLFPGKVAVSWSAPSNAARYLVYRSTSASVPAVYANLITPVSGITNRGLLDDVSALPDGTYYYRVVPVSASNIQGASAVASATIANISVLTKSRPGPSHAGGPGANSGPEYVELAGTWTDSSVSSSAAGNPAFGSRFTTTGNAAAAFRPAITVPGFYVADYTTNNASSHNASVEVLVQGSFAGTTFTTPLTGATNGNVWTPLNETPLYLEAGSSDAARQVRLTRVAGPDRLNTDAVRFRLVETYPALRSVTTGASATATFLARDSRAVTLELNNVTVDGTGQIAFEDKTTVNTGGLLVESRLIAQSFEITPSGGIAFDDATVTFSYDPARLGGLSNNAADLNTVYSIDAGNNVTVYNGANASFDHGNSTVTVTGVAGFSTWYIGDEDALATTSIHDWMLLSH